MLSNRRFLYLFSFFFLIMTSAQLRAATGSLSVGFVGNHDSLGAYVDVTAHQDLRITGFDLNLEVGAVTVSIYSKVGAVTVADLTNAAAWTLYQTVNVTGNGQGIATNVAINPFPIVSGQTVAFATVADTNGKMFNGDNGGATTNATDAAMTILSAHETHNLFNDNYTGWPWQGTVHYETGLIGSTAAIPTLSEWALLLLMLSLGFVGFRVSHQRVK